MKENNSNNELRKSLTPDLVKYVKKRSKLRFLSMDHLFMMILASGFIITTILLNIPVPFVIVYLIKKKMNLYRRYCFVLLNGDITESKIKSIDNEWTYQINETPRTILDLEIEGREIRIKTFAPEILDCCNDSVLKLIWHGNMPDIIIPEGGKPFL